jgi:hypothetical protein
MPKKHERTAAKIPRLKKIDKNVRHGASAYQIPIPSVRLLDVQLSENEAAQMMM